MSKLTLLSASIASLFLSSFGFSSLTHAFEDSFKITPLTASDERFFEKQRTIIDNLAKEHLGRQLRGEVNADLETLQLLLNKSVVTKKQPAQLQAMGVVLGDLYVKELGVHWVVYTDNKGRSRALQWTSSEHVLFPITMISRRVAVDIKVNIQELYDKGLKVLHRVIQDENRKKLLNIR